jgi:uncharacterized protein (DUF58 family)
MTPVTAARVPAFAFDGVVRLTKVGTTYLIFTIVIGFAALNTGNNALYIALTFMLGCLLLSGVASKGGLKHLEVELRGIDQAWAGRPAYGMLRVTNRSRIWNVRDVVITSADLSEPILLPMVSKRASMDVTASFFFQRRGIARVKSVDLYTRYPFGFFLKKRRVRLSGEVVVFPRLLPEDGARERFRPIIGEQISGNRPGPGTEIHSFRDYARGDSMRHVYWKKSASIGRWIMKQTDLEAAQAVHVVLDPYKPHDASSDEFEEMVSAAATFLYYSVRRDMNVMLSLPGVTLQASDPNGANSIFSALAILEPAFEPVYQAIELTSVVFSLRGIREFASA